MATIFKCDLCGAEKVSGKQVGEMEMREPGKGVTDILKYDICIGCCNDIHREIKRIKEATNPYDTKQT
jgi:hypothetical protein